MAADFWTSSHCNRLMEREKVDVVPLLDSEMGLTLEEFKLIKIHMANYIWRLAQHVKLRQRVVATALAYFKRVYTRKSMLEFDPHLVAPTCLYLASKVEESMVPAKFLLYYIRKKGLDKRHQYVTKDIFEMEIKLLEALDCFLLVYHPYCALKRLLLDAGMTDLTELCWSIINDTYKMDLILVYPPHMIALACTHVASALKEKDAASWFEELNVDMNVINNISMEILDFYDAYREIPEERINAAMNKVILKA